MKASHEAQAEAERSVCPGLSPEVAWDAVDALRGELYASDHLTNHAAELAHAHGTPVLQRTGGPLRKRFALAQKQLRSAYDVLARAAKGRRDPSPAEEWLLDNSHVVEDQIREIQEDLPWGYLIELPRVASGAMAGYPRVYGLCLDYLRHTDAHLDLKGLADYVTSYQRVAPLTIGELWAVPIMLRLGLTLIVSALAVSEARTRDRERADEWADRFIVEAGNTERLERALSSLEKSNTELTDALLVQLLKRVRDHDAPLVPVVDWIAARCAAMGTSPEELTRRQHLRQAADHVSVGNAISSMRAIAALDWTEFFQLTSRVEAVLQRDPARAYPLMDQASRDRCRHAVERLARGSRKDELAVAEAALARASASALEDSSSARAHVGYFLVDRGLDELERELAYRPRVKELPARALLKAPRLCYFASFALLWLLLALLSYALLSRFVDSRLLRGGLWLLSAIPLSELSSSLLSAIALVVVKPRLLSRLDFKHGIPDEHRTLVVVPCLLESESGLAELLEDLEIRGLANPDRNLSLALVTDFVDSDVAENESDRALLDRAVQGIEQLNRDAGEARYFLLHRQRVPCPVQGRYMGWERKRGKLHELNRLLRGATDTTFARVTAPSELLSSIRYVITLDADTQLPREVARRLVGTMAHPLNRPLLDRARQRVVRGYGIIQPRVGISPPSSRRSRFARILGGPPGVDPYTTAVSDLYQDLFGEGSFLGKGIYDVDAFAAALTGRVPDNALLSHDLFEGCFARTALASDIEVLDDQPATYEVMASRDHRWLRGDWQLLPWLLPRVPAAEGEKRRNDLSLLDYWKLADNLRRSLVAPTLVTLLAAACFGPRGAMPWALGLALAVFLAPIVVRQVLTLTRAALSPQARASGLGGEFLINLEQALLNLVLLLDRALLSLDAIARTWYRLLISRRHLLEWTTMRQAARRHRDGNLRASARFVSSGWLALALLIAVPVVARAGLPLALTIGLPWLCAPGLLDWLGRQEKEPPPDAELRETDRRRLRRLARKTWRFFDEFVTAADNWLPPDNFQEEPRPVVAHRTSPTNIGLYLLSVVSAHDLGFITAREMLERLEHTLDTISRLERRSGHILNWYDTTSLQPLEPQYVSTVDSGNLAAYLWTLREACAELSDSPLIDPMCFESARDALHLAWLELGGKRSELASALSRLDLRLPSEAAELERGAIAGFAALTRARDAVLDLQRLVEAQNARGEARYWIEQAAAVLSKACADTAQLAPCLPWLGARQLPWPPGEAAELCDELLARIAQAKSPRELASAAASFREELPNLEQAAADAAPPSLQLLARSLSACLLASEQACEKLGESAAELGRRALELADGMDFRFLYDEQRSLFSIGYNVSGARLDGSHYDLLASEARLASLIAISKGDAPLQHWWKLGRARTATSGGKVLLSWSGSMFEYLMPLLVTGVSRDTLLWETCSSAVTRQRQYGQEHQVPWGISESAYNVMDLGMCYQYRAFGVPGLGFKSGLAEDLVIAPYASVLAALVRPDFALANFDALDQAGLAGKYGYYEAVDFTEARVPPERRSVVVKAFMAHHQGMSLVALGNVLGNWPMRRRFFADARVRASALLLEERTPLTTPTTAVRSDDVPARSSAEPELRLTDHVGIGARGVERLHLLGHGELSSIISAAGTGVLRWRGLDVTRFREDSTLDAHGILIYVRDLSARKLWTAGPRPTATVPDYFDAAFSIDRVQLKRRDGAIETVTELVVSPEHPMEVRRITLTNHGSRTAELDLTSYTEPVLAPHGADVAHRAFSSMFLNVELLHERGAALVHRRPRSPGEAEAWMLQVLTTEGEESGVTELEGSRAQFIGRGGSLQNPRALRVGHKLSGTAGDVLDPALSLRRKLSLSAGGRARVVLTTALASSREAALELLDLITAPHAAARAFELAWADARVELRHLGITAARSHRFQRLLSCLLRAPRSLREASPWSSPLKSGKSALYSQGISGDLPLLVLRVDSPDFSELGSDLLVAHEFWRLNGVSSDLLLLNEEPQGYLQPVHEALDELLRKSPAAGHIDQSGGVYLRHASQISAEDRQLLLRAANLVLRASAGSLSQQLRRAGEQAEWPERLPVRRSVDSANGAGVPAPRNLRLFNGIGGFSSDGREYVMHVGPGARPPAPWCNVMANERFGSVVSEQGLGFSWCNNSQRSRLTPFSNDAVEDPSGEIVYLRDDVDGSVWSATPAPASLQTQFRVRHGQGYSIFSQLHAGLEQELAVCVSATDPVKLLRLRLRNRGAKRRKLSVYAVAEWVLGAARDATRLHVSSEWEPSASALLANNPLSGTPEAHAFIASAAPVTSYTGDREEFFGRSASRARPAALGRTRLSGHAGVGFDPCAALQITCELAADETRELCFVLGQGDTREHAQRLAVAFAAPTAFAEAFDALGPVWDSACAVTVQSPDEAFDLMINRWLPYQVLSARVWARTGFYQSSGAFGFRDQLQDVLAMLHARPDVTRAHLLRAAARQFREGDVQHWWHPDTGEGVRTRCSDDLVFLPYAVAAYVDATGDTGILEEQVPFLQARALNDDEDDVFSAPAASGSASLYEHCVAALERAITQGPHGLPKIGSGDWNDGMNRVGRDGRGESVWLGWFLVRTLRDFARVAAGRADHPRENAWRTEADRLIQALEASWDGDWYRRAYFDDGSPLGSHVNRDCRIDAIAQSWAVLAGADRTRARRALDSSIAQLVMQDARLMKLLTPPFTGNGPDPGYIRSYPPGIRENGGQYSHGVLWTVEALAALGDGARAHWLLSLLNPISHATKPNEVERYRVEPYVLAGDVYASAEHLGRGGWTWYTGAAAWMYRIGVESILGLRRRGSSLAISPCVPPTWRQLSVTYRYGRSELALVLHNPRGFSSGVSRIELDGQDVWGQAVPLIDDGRRHQATVWLGADSSSSTSSHPELQAREAE